jgi:hypothetical protein
MCRVNRIFFNASVLSIALCGILPTIGYAQSSLTQNGFVTPEDVPTFVTTNTGQQASLTTNIFCPIQTPEPTITFFKSTSPDTAGTVIGSYTLNSETGFVWTITGSTGTFYISAFVALNGATGCTGGPESATAITVQTNID